MRARIAEQTEARTLQQGGRSVKEIARVLRVSPGSVSAWVQTVSLRAHARARLAEHELRGGTRGRRKILARWREYRLLHPKRASAPRPIRPVESFFDRWSPEMAYVLGYFAADGCMFRNPRGSYYFQFTSTNAQLLVLVRKLLKATNAIERYRPKSVAWKTRYSLQVGSRRVFEQLQSLGFTPAKSLILRWPLVPAKVLSHFVRGYFDGDGCIAYGSYVHSGTKVPTRQLFVQFVSGSRRFLQGLHDALRNVDAVAGGSLSLASSGFHLQYSTRDAIRLHQFIYPRYDIPCLHRKRVKFQKALRFLGP